MANLYKRKNSPFYWLKRKDPRTGEIVRESTHHKIGGEGHRLAKAMLTQAKATEAVAPGRAAATRWERWVPEYLSIRYQNPKTLNRVRYGWVNITAFLEAFHINYPADLTREHCLKYIGWRIDPKNAVDGIARAGYNTAFIELLFLRLVADEAARRQFRPPGMLAALRIPRRAPTLKPEIEEEDLVLIEQSIDKLPERTPQEADKKQFLRNSFLIARYQGCRIAETHLNPQTAVDLDNGTITFLIKGGKNHTTLLSPALVPLFKDLIDRGAVETYDGTNKSCPSIRWRRFFKEIGLLDRCKGICFHSFRVTVATKLARAGAPIANAMRFMGHKGQTIHLAYQRLAPKDLAGCARALYGASTASPPSSSNPDAAASS